MFKANLQSILQIHKQLRKWYSDWNMISRKYLQWQRACSYTEKAPRRDKISCKTSTWMHARLTDHLHRRYNRQMILLGRTVTSGVGGTGAAVVVVVVTGGFVVVGGGVVVVIWTVFRVWTTQSKRKSDTLPYTLKQVAKWKKKKIKEKDERK